MYLRRSTTIKYFIAAIIGAFLYCEWAIYLVQPLYWQEFKCDDSDPTCSKILFIADPQIQGDAAVPPPLGYLFNWDSDRYLQSTFKVVMTHFKPDVLVFMGDLMDEGSIASVRQFHKYVKRLSDIFEIPYPVKLIWLPGDNDIGGENEPIKQDKVELFETIFYQPSIINHKNISFYKVNGITHTIPKDDKKYDSTFKVVVSHYPTTSRHAFAKQVNNAIHPDIFFCAHDHDSRYVKQTKDLTHSESHRILDTDKPLHLRFDEEFVYEIYVPTCSYRMGTSHIGYGAAILDHNNQHLGYTVFWSPTRFPYLFFYLGVLILLSLYFMVFCVAKLFHARGTQTKFSQDKLPFLESM